MSVIKYLKLKRNAKKASVKSNDKFINGNKRKQIDALGMGFLTLRTMS
jgi:hypothetical protein